ncbi:MAG TPA: hypothetical protein PLH72_02840 [Vicinamibacterales bacterium]|nr:hypothetical protein [Vicinamibacterales bacterium]
MSKAKVRGFDVTFTAGDRTFTGQVDGEMMEGTVTSAEGTRPWHATRVSKPAGR